MSAYCPQLAIIVPCFNEEEVLPEAKTRFVSLLNEMIDAGLTRDDSFVMFIDDGSKDRTWGLIEENAANEPLIRGLKLSRNRGHQNAVLAGLLEAPGDLLVSIDADLQDDITAIRTMVEVCRDKNCEVVYGVRSDRSTDTFFKRFTAQSYYRLLKGLGVDIVYNHADFRMMSRTAIDGLRQHGEVNLFLRGIVPLIGYQSEIVEYARAERFAGESKYPLRKMLSLAWNGVTSFSVRPLRLISTFGFVVSVASFIAGLSAIIADGVGFTVEGWTSLIVAVFFLGGVQLLAIGIIGEYVGKIYLEVKNRPRYIVEKMV